MLISSLCQFSRAGGQRRVRAANAVRKLFQEHSRALSYLCAAAIVMQLSPLSIPLVLRFFLGEVGSAPTGSDHQIKPLSPTSFTDQQLRLLWTLSACVALIGIIRGLSTYLFLKWGGQCGHHFVAGFRTLAYAQLLRLPVRYVEQRGSGRILLRFIGDTDALRSWVSRTGPKLLADGVCGAVIVGAMLLINFRLTCQLLLPVAAMALVVWLCSTFLRAKTRESRRSQADLTGYVADRLNAIRTTKIVDARGHLRQPVWSHIQHVAATNATRDQISATLESVGQVTVFTAVPLVLVSGLQQTWSGRLPVSDFLAFLWLAIHFITILRTALPAIVVQQKALVSVQRLHALLTRSAESGRGRQAARIPAWTLECGYTLSSQRGGSASESNAPQSGTFICPGPGVYRLPAEIRGEMLFAALVGFDAWTTGSLLLGGLPVCSTKVVARRRKILMLSSQPPLIEGTLAENLVLFCSGKTTSTQLTGPTQLTGMATNPVWEALGDLQLPLHWQSCQPELTGRILHRRHTLSAAEERRIAACQILLAKPHILVIPASTVDTWPANELDIVIEQTRRRAIVVIGSAKGCCSNDHTPATTQAQDGHLTIER